MPYRPPISPLGRRSHLATLVVASAIMAGCTNVKERPVQDSAAMAQDGGDTAPRRLASDAVLSLLNVSRLAVPLRVAADSFGVGEAVSVRQETIDTAGLRDLANTTDVLVLPAEWFPRTLVPSRTSWYVLFARDRIVLAYGDSSRGAATIDSTNWWKVLQRRGVRVGRVDPAAEPAGYRALLVMQLAESHYEQPKLAATLLRASPVATVRLNEAALVAGLDSMTLDYIWTHESTARAANLRYVRLPPEIDLGEPADSARYAEAEVVVSLTAPDTVRLRGAPILYGISILNGAPSPRHAERFLRYLFSDDGRRVLQSAYLDVLPRLTAVGTDVPPTILAALGPLATPVAPVVDATADTAATTQRKPPK